MREIINRIEVWACTVPLPARLHFGAFSVASRRYVALRVGTAGGLAADVIGHTRGSPVDVAISDVFAPVLIGSDAADISGRVQDFHRTTLATERDGVLGRAWSLLELALRGLQASVRNEPLWKALGGKARQIPVQLIEGYTLPDESDESFAQRLIGRVCEGYAALKIEGASYLDQRTLIRRLELVRRDAPDCRLVVDFAWSWKHAHEHVEMISALEALDIDWIEDAFPREAILEYVNAAKLTRTAFGCGDEATRAADLVALVDGSPLEVVRLDATALGGVSAVMPLAADLTTRGRRVSFHDFPEIHEHCVLAGTDVDHVEMFPIDRPFDVRHQLMLECAQQRVHAGRLTPSSRAGIGTRLDMTAVERYAVRHQLIAA